MLPYAQSKGAPAGRVEPRGVLRKVGPGHDGRLEVREQTTKVTEGREQNGRPTSFADDVDGWRGKGLSSAQPTAIGRDCLVVDTEVPKPKTDPPRGRGEELTGGTTPTPTPGSPVPRGQGPPSTTSHVQPKVLR